MCGHEEDGAGVPSVPRLGSEHPLGRVAILDLVSVRVLDAECASCGRAIEWDVRNLWSHSG